MSNENTMIHAQRTTSKFHKEKRPKVNAIKTLIKIVRADVDKKDRFYVMSTISIRRFMMKYYDMNKTEKNHLHFVFKGQIIDNDDTPKSLGMLDEDIIVVFNARKLAESKFN